jgi:hypothetical protein
MRVVAWGANWVPPGVSMSVHGPVRVLEVCHRIVTGDRVVTEAVKSAVFPSGTVCAAGSTATSRCAEPVSVGLGAVVVVVALLVPLAPPSSRGAVAALAGAGSATMTSATVSSPADRRTHRVPIGACRWFMARSFLRCWRSSFRCRNGGNEMS